MTTLSFSDDKDDDDYAEVSLYSLDDAIKGESFTNFTDSLKIFQGTNYHYVTVTGVLVDRNTGKVYLRIQSWGKMLYIDYDEFYDVCINGVGYDSFTEIGEMNVSCVIYAI